MIRWVSAGDGVSRGDVCDDVHVLCLVRCMHHLCVWGEGHEWVGSIVEGGEPVDNLGTFHA